MSETTNQTPEASENPFIFIAQLCQKAADGDGTALACLGLLKNLQTLQSQSLKLDLQLAQSDLALTDLVKNQDVILGH